MKDFFRMTRFGIADIWLGRLSRQGPMGFFHSYGRYLEFTRPLLLTNQLDAIVVATDPSLALRRVFGTPYSEKPWWPWGYSVADPSAPARTTVADAGGQ